MTVPTVIAIQLRRINAFQILGYRYRDMLKNAAQQALNSGIYHEFFRALCFDDHLGDFQQLLFDLEINPLNHLDERDIETAIHLCANDILASFLESTDINCERVHDLSWTISEEINVETSVFADFFIVWRRWHFDYTEWMEGQEYEKQKSKSLQLLINAAQKYVVNHDDLIL